MHIVAYLGYLIGSDSTGGFRYVIISRDRDYDKIIDFLEKETGVKVERTASIDPSEAKKAEAKAKRRAHAGKKSSGSTAARSGKSGGQKSAAGEASSEEQETERKKRPDGNNNRGRNRSGGGRRQAENRNTVRGGRPSSPEKAEPMSRSQNDIKPQREPDIRTRMNQDIQKKLSAAGMPAEVVNYVASVAVKNAGDKDGKQITYQAIVKKYGMVKGLNIYRHVKKMIP